MLKQYYVAAPVGEGTGHHVRGVIARACYHLNKDQLIDFCNLLKGESQEHPAVKMVNAFRHSGLSSLKLEVD